MERIRMKTVIGIVTFGNAQFTKLTIESIRATTKSEIHFAIIVGKPGDTETEAMLANQLDQFGDVSVKAHDRNMGFPYSVNDLYDFAWKDNDYHYLIIAGNDIVPYEGAIDTLIRVADTTEYEVISALQYDVKSLVNEHPETKKYFYSQNYIFTDFNARPWEAYKPVIDPAQAEIASMQLYDIQNLCLYKKSVMSTIGYTDVNFYPAYYIDNDYARRIVNAGIPCCSVVNARFFHFWSRTIKQGTGGSTGTNFDNNRSYYMSKWGGDFGQERIEAPILIDSREGEEEIIEKWRRA